MTDGYFFKLTPEKVLDAVENSGLHCTGRCMALNSFENRVYDVELDPDELSEKSFGDLDRMAYFYRSRIVKFYRPGRWSEEQILEEHRFLAELQNEEIPVIAPLTFPDGNTLQKTQDGIYYCLFPKAAGRAPDELTDEKTARLGRLLARIHTVGAARPSASRLHLNPQTYGLANLKFLRDEGWLPEDISNAYCEAIEKLCEAGEKGFQGLKLQRIHGDCHFGNLLWNSAGPFFLDFDDMVMGPPVQDVWLLTPGRDPEALRQRELLVEGYEQMKNFDRNSLKLIEVLRGLRFIHFSSWIARRWKDPAFPSAFPHFGTPNYWRNELRNLQEQVELVSESVV
ncbi:MAG: serine/threonine protein kinase [Bdellovibrio sp.]|nr:serine/threonine protein kinase [Bdellovibrio sp.]